MVPSVRCWRFLMSMSYLAIDSFENLHGTCNNKSDVRVGNVVFRGSLLKEVLLSLHFQRCVAPWHGDTVTQAEFVATVTRRMHTPMGDFVGDSANRGFRTGFLQQLCDKPKHGYYSSRTSRWAETCQLTTVMVDEGMQSWIRIGRSRRMKKLYRKGDVIEAEWRDINLNYILCPQRQSHCVGRRAVCSAVAFALLLAISLWTANKPWVIFFVSWLYIYMPINHWPHRKVPHNAEKYHWQSRSASAVKSEWNVGRQEEAEG